MKTIVTKLLLFSLLITVFWGHEVMAQKKGEFVDFVDGGSRKIAFNVPYNYSPEKSYPLIIGLHPMGSPPESMVGMLRNAATELGAIVACPDDKNTSGKTLPFLYDYCVENYNIDLDDVIITGYSIGGIHTFKYGIANQDKIRGIVAIAPSGTIQDYYEVIDLPIAIICGANDGVINKARTIVEGVNGVGGHAKLVEKAGVGHMGPYFGGPEFHHDWVDCYDFIHSFALPKDPVVLGSPASGSEGHEASIDLVWNKSEGALSYDLEVFSADGGAKVREGQTEDTTITLTKMKPNSTFFWKIREVNENGAEPWSSLWGFSTGDFVSVQDMTISSGKILKSNAYPNPASDETAIKFESSAAGDVQLMIYDINGNILYTSDAEIMSQGENLLQVDLSNFVTGSYIYQIRTDKIVEYGKIVVNK